MDKFSSLPDMLHIAETKLHLLRRSILAELSVREDSPFSPAQDFFPETMMLGMVNVLFELEESMKDMYNDAVQANLEYEGIQDDIEDAKGELEEAQERLKSITGLSMDEEEHEAIQDLQETIHGESNGEESERENLGVLQ